MIRVTKTNLQDVLLVKPEVFEDHRGQYVELYNEDEHGHNWVEQHFVQDDISVSYHNVLRGIHGDDRTWKLISCLYGRIYLVVVNCNPVSPQFKQWQSFVISDTNRNQILVPPKHGNGHLVLSEQAIFWYKQSEYYLPKNQFTVKWDDPAYHIWWPCKDPILSVRDATANLTSETGWPT